MSGDSRFYWELTLYKPMMVFAVHGHKLKRLLQYTESSMYETHFAVS